MDERPDEYAWMLHAKCRGISPSEFFPSDGVGVEAAQRICHDCPVRLDCLEYALEHRIEHGVWGGASERERRRILRRRRQEVAGADEAGIDDERIDEMERPLESASRPA